MKDKVLFLGWDQEYELYAINTLSTDYDLKICALNNLFLVIYNHLNERLRRIYINLICFFLRFKFKDNYDLISVCDSKFYCEISKKITSRKKAIIFRNVVGDRRELTKFEGYLNFTFNSYDEIKYGMYGYNQFLSLPKWKKKKKEDELDEIYFLGMKKGRWTSIRNLKIAVKELGIKSNIIVVEKPKSIYDKILFKTPFRRKKNKHISYMENIRNIDSSKVLIDITNEGQVGLTLRVLEAIFLNKKLITNNKTIKKMKFYDPDKIKIVDFLNYDDLLEQLSDYGFFNSNVPDYDDEFLNTFDGYQVLNKLVRFCLK